MSLEDLPPPIPGYASNLPPTWPPPPDLSSSRLLALPKDLLIQILSTLSPSDLARVCGSSTTLANLCRSEELWTYKHVQTFKSPFPKPDPRLIYYRQRLKMLVLKLREAEASLTAQLLNLFREVFATMITQNPLTSLNLIKPLIQSIISGSNYYIQRGCLDRHGDIEECYQRFKDSLLQRFSPPRHGPDLGQNIDLTAKVFNEYPLEQFPSPLEALIKAIFDILLAYEIEMHDIKSENHKLDVFIDLNTYPS